MGFSVEGLFGIGAFGQTPEGYISKDIYPLIYILKSLQKDISYHFLEKDILGI
jgi:hypothetical protein